AGPDELAFIGAERYRATAPSSGAAAFLVPRGVAVAGDARPRIEVDDVDLASIRVLTLFAPEPSRPQPGVHPAAWVHPSAELGAEVRVGALATIDARCRIGDGVTIHPGVHLYSDVTIGDGTEIHAGTVIRERCEIGRGVIMHPNVTIGADGFGFRPDTSGPVPRLVKIPQIGVVRIGNDVEIGAGTTIDRAKFDATILGDGCKIDNQVQIGHNVILGRMVVIAGCAGIGGSSTVGDGTMIGGLTCISDHVNIGSRCRVAGSSACINDIPDGETWGGLPAKPLKDTFKEEIALRKLPALMREMNRAKLKAKKDEERKQP
ncbi:MAG: UDP-3-O-(3-hydroxymyristoyl)glucosamine N-acyltransferase, partial [Phycisphaerales bacterium JB063]